MNKLDWLIGVVTKNYFRVIISISVISFLSLWLLLFYFFSWEEFSFFYAYQDPEAYKVVFDSHGFLNHPLLRHLGFLFYLFDYNPVPYNILSILTFSLLSITVYLFSKSTLNLDKNTAFFSGLIFAAGYYGVGTFITNTYSGYNGGFGLILLLLSMILFNKLIRKFKLVYLLSFILIYLLSIILFSARTFMLPGLLVVLLIFRVRNLFIIFISSILLFLPLFIFLQYQQGVLESSLTRIDFSYYDYFKSISGNIGHTFFPSMILRNESIAIFLGFAISVACLVKKEARLPFLLTAVSIAVMLIALLVNSQYFMIWLSDNHDVSSFMIFAAPTIAILLKRHSKFLTILVIFIVILSNIEVYNQLQNHSNRLRYFYETIQKLVPRTESKQVILIYSKYPKPLDPFIHLPEIPGEYYVPGFYHKKASDMLVTQDYYQALDFINSSKISKNDIYVLTFANNDLKDSSNEFREILFNKNDAQTFIQFENLNLSGLVPLEIEMPISLPNQELPKDPELQNYYNWDNRITVETIPDKPLGDRKKEYLLDNDFETTWIPGNWESPVEIILKLSQPKVIEKIVWSSSRTNPWVQRIPTDYNFLISSDGINWKKVTEVKKGQKLLKNDFRVEEINSNEQTSFVKMEIYKTAEGGLPALDDIQILPEEIANVNYNTINDFFRSRIQKVCLQWTTNDDSEFRNQRQACVDVVEGNKTKIKIEPRIEKVTGFRIVDKDNKKIDVSNLSIKYTF